MNKTVKYFGPLGPGTQAHWGGFAPPNPPEFRGGPKGPPHPPYIGGLKPPKPPLGGLRPPRPPCIFQGGFAPSSSPFPLPFYMKKTMAIPWPWPWHGHGHGHGHGHEPGPHLPLSGQTLTKKRPLFLVHLKRTAASVRSKWW